MTNPHAAFTAELAVLRQRDLLREAAETQPVHPRFRLSHRPRGVRAGPGHRAAAARRRDAD